MANEKAEKNPWFLAIRPKTLPAAIAPVIVGSALAFSYYSFEVGPAIACLIVAVLLQIGSNLANDVFDFEKGADAGVRFGPIRVTQAGLLTPTEVKRGMWFVFGITGLIGLYLISIGGWVIFIAGIAAILSAIAYTGGPIPLGYHGLGDVFVFIFFGLVATAGTYFLQVGDISLVVWGMGAAMGALTVNILAVNNLRDINSDTKIGKRTLAVRLGVRGVTYQYFLLLATAYILPIYLTISNNISAWGLITLISLPIGFKWAIFVTRNKGADLNRALAGTGRVELLYAILFFLGMVLSRLPLFSK